MFRQIIVILALISCALTAYGAGVYKWVDENGSVWYRDIPPPQGVTYQALPKPTGSQYNPSATMQKLRDKVKALDTAHTKNNKKVAQRTENCEITQKNLDILATSENPVRLDNEGNRVPLSAADRKTALQEQQQYLAQYCSL